MLISHDGSELIAKDRTIPCECAVLCKERLSPVQLLERITPVLLLKQLRVRFDSWRLENPNSKNGFDSAAHNRTS
jgi:hypothetical protein